MIWIWLIMMAGLYMVLFSTVLKINKLTWGIFFIYKLIPYILGLACILYGVKEMNWI